MSIIIGTAGHVDHGKTSLVKALTGIETDRLIEEKKRGITIDLGFAYLTAQDGEKVAIIDVPGHERFVKNMVSGAAGFDLAMLVIAADEGVMPQTKEHLGILSVLNIQSGVVVLSKSDLVDEEWLSLTTEEVREYLKGTFLQDAPIVAVSSSTGDGIEHLKQLLLQLAQSTKTKNSTSGAFRIPIDRVFIMDGFGTVITGTLLEGTVNVGQEAVLYPSMQAVKVRTLQVHGKQVQTAAAGQRVAVNLAGVKKENVQRGETLASVNSMQTTQMFDVKFQMLRDIKRTLKNGERVHLYHGAAETIAKAVLLDSDKLEKGDGGFIQFRLEQPVAIKPSDYIIARSYSPMETLGGGTVLNVAPSKHRRYKQDVLSALEQGEKDNIEYILLQINNKYKKYTELAKQYGKTAAQTKAALDSLVQGAKAIALTSEVYLAMEHFTVLQNASSKLLVDFHAARPLEAGISKEEFRSRLLDTKESALTTALIQKLERSEIIKVQGAFISLKGFNVSLTPEMQQLKATIESTYKKAGYILPETESLINSCQNKAAAKQLIEQLIQEKKVFKMSPEYNIDAGAFNKAIEVLKKHFEINDKITLAEFRDEAGSSRKYSMLLLDYCDSMRITRKIDDYRILLKK